MKTLHNNGTNHGWVPKKFFISQHLKHLNKPSNFFILKQKVLFSSKKIVSHLKSDAHLPKIFVLLA